MRCGVDSEGECQETGLFLCTGVRFDVPSGPLILSVISSLESLLVHKPLVTDGVHTRDLKSFGL